MSFSYGLSNRSVARCTFIDQIKSVTSSCKPQLAHTILSEPGLKEALAGKLLVSILAGVTMEQLKGWVPPTTRVVRAMPNTPCKAWATSTLNYAFNP